ncbi:hypothetical protein MNBD_GAMMA17-1782 [hydrothermal vent metagenome]|uniref:non-specific protein-tyrosine kinase n=1 Tax=hydrothermal vent metagenome TaxID=652676 RepID=A0A3B0Z863_9ZZZZ
MKNAANLPPQIQTNSINPVPSTEEESIDIAQYWRIIKRHKLGIFNITLICLIIGVLAALSTTPIYKAETKLIANPIQPNLDTRDQYVNSALIFLFYETQYEIIRSLNIAKKAVDKLGLVAQHNTEQALIPESTAEELRVTLASNIQAKINVEGGKQSEIIRVSYEDPDPQLAADITNAIAEAYMEFGLESRLNGAKQTSTWLNDQLHDLRTTLKESEDSLQTYQKNQGMVDTNQQAQLAATRLSALITELTRAQTKRSEAEIRYKQINSKHESGDYASLTPILNNRSSQDNRTAQALEQSAIKASRTVQELSERYGEKHPKMIAARADLHEAKQNLKAEIDKVAARVHKEFLAASDQEKQLKTLIRKEKSDLSTIKGNSFELARLEREVFNNQKLYESFLGRFQESNVSEQYDVSNVHILDIARTPAAPFKPNKPRFIIIALVSGLFMGTLFAFLREHLDNTFKTTEELEEKLKLPTLGVIPLIKQNKNTVTPQRQVLADSRSQFSENVNNIRTGLLFSNIDNPPKTILVTSATAMEGKSTLAINLAASLSQLGNTLLLEVDLRKPSTAKYMETPLVPGIVDQALHKESNLEDAITRVGSENSQFYVMPAGNFSPNPLELLSSEYFKNHLETLKKKFTYIVLDGPVLAVSDAIVVGQLVDSVIIAVKAESTKIKMVQETVSRLGKANVVVTGTVLCQADAVRMNYYGSNYYDASHYGYRDAAREGTGSIADRS